VADEPAPGSGRGEGPVRGPVPGGPGWGMSSGGDRAGGAARGFASGGPLDAALPGAALTRALDEASGQARRCEGASDDEAFGMLGRWEAAEAWCASAKLGVIRELIRRRALPGFEPVTPGGLPGAWEEGNRTAAERAEEQHAGGRHISRLGYQRSNWTVNTTTILKGQRHNPRSPRKYHAVRVRGHMPMLVYGLQARHGSDLRPPWLR